MCFLCTLCPHQSFYPSRGACQSQTCTLLLLCYVFEFQILANFVILYMIEFNKNLGLTWFPPYYIVLNCYTKSMTLKLLRREKLEWEGEYIPKTTKVISSIRAKKLVGQGCSMYLDHI